MIVGLLVLSLSSRAWAADAPPEDSRIIRPEPAPPSWVAPANNVAPAPAPLPAAQPPSPAPAVPAELLRPTENVPGGSRPLLIAPILRRNSLFQIEAPDSASAQKVLDLAVKAQELLARYFPWPDHAPLLIEIHLVPDVAANFSGPFVVPQENGGQYYALIRWSPETKFADVCQALARVSLENLVLWRDGPAAAAKSPGWLLLAFGKMLEASAKPALTDALAQQAEQAPPLSLHQIMTASEPSGDAAPIIAVNAYWLARFLDQECGQRGPDLAASLFSALAAGVDPAKVISAAFPDLLLPAAGGGADVRDLELWWQVGYRDLTLTRGAPVQTMAQSRAQLDQLEYLDLPRPDAGPQRTRLDAAWAGRTEKSVRDYLAAVVVNARLKPFQTNPVYYNAMLSLLIALDKLHGDNEKEFRDAWAQYLADRADAETCESTVAAALRGN